MRMSLQQAYPVEYTKPIREQLQAHNVKELLTAQEVQEALTQETVLILINSVCGCAAANARHVRVCKNQVKRLFIHASVKNIDFIRVIRRPLFHLRRLG